MNKTSINQLLRMPPTRRGPYGEETRLVVGDPGLSLVKLRQTTRSERHSHQHRTEIVIVIEGHPRIEVNGERDLLGEGSAVVIPPNSWHQIWNDHIKDVLLWVVSDPPWSNEDNFIDPNDS